MKGVQSNPPTTEWLSTYKKKPLWINRKGFCVSDGFFINGLTVEKANQTFFVTKPLLRQRVHILIVIVVPPISVLTATMFGFHVRR